MTTPPDLDERFGDVWEFARGLEAEIAELKTWKATVEAVSTWQRWAIPLALSILAGSISIINALLLTKHQ